MFVAQPFINRKIGDVRVAPTKPFTGRIVVPSRRAALVRSMAMRDAATAISVATVIKATPPVIDRVRGALWGVFIADALSMPVHWYYNVSALKRDFGEIKTYQAPKDRHPDSIMSVSNTGGHGRGDQSGRIVGDVILHGKHQFWGKSNVHYHQGMKAGENTLNALCTRVVMRAMASQGGYNAAQVLSDYVTFMTTPGTHNDTYAESFHRDFFKNFAAGVAPEKCARGTEGHNTAQIGGFVMLPPVILGALGSGRDAAIKAALQHLALTHDSKKLAAVAGVYAGLMFDLATGEDARKSLSRAASDVGLDVERAMRYNYDDLQAIHNVFGSACYIESSMPAILYLSYKYAGNFEGAVLANTNVGGENCHRGSALGALMGAAVGESGIPQHFITDLHASAEIKKEIDSFVSALFPGSTSPASGAPHTEL